jgi:hypothetical protein
MVVEMLIGFGTYSGRARHPSSAAARHAIQALRLPGTPSKLCGLSTLGGKQPPQPATPEDNTREAGES